MRGKIRICLLFCLLGFLFFNPLQAKASSELLFFSDHPERVKERGLLFDGGLSRNFPVRFYFYHQGDTSLPELNLNLLLYNPEFNSPARIKVKKTISGPGLNAFEVGSRAVKDFLAKELLGDTDLITVNSGEKKLFWQDRLLPDYVVNGIISFEVIEGGPVFVSLFARKSPEELFAFNRLDPALDPHCRGVFAPTRVFKELKFDLSKPSAFITLGEESYKNILPGRVLKGGYGIIYYLKLVLNNPQKQEGTVSLFFQPRGGAAGATFYFRDSFWEIKPQQAYSQALVFRVKVLAGEQKTLELITIPEGGSNYPVRLILNRSWR